MYKPGEKGYDTTQGKKGHLSPGQEAKLPYFPGVPRVKLPHELELNPPLANDLGYPARSPSVVVFPGSLPTGLPVGGSIPVAGIPPMVWDPVVVLP